MADVPLSDEVHVPRPVLTICGRTTAVTTSTTMCGAVEDADSGRLRAQSLESPAPPNPGTGSRNTDSSDSSDSGSSDSGSGDSGSSDSGSRDSESSESESSDDSEDAAAGAKAEQVCSEAEAGGGSARGARGGGPDGDTESDDSFKPAARATARKSKMLMVVSSATPQQVVFVIVDSKHLPRSAQITQLLHIMRDIR